METKSTKQRFIDAGYLWIKPVNLPPGSARRIIHDPQLTGNYWIINSPEEANELADILLWHV